MSARAGRLAVWPPLPTEEELTTAGLSRDGQHVMGWVKPPAGKVWTPNDGTLLWLPPSATKSTDLDAAGRIVDVILTPGGTAAWVVAQLDRHEKYLDMLRARVRSGVMRLTAALAKKLGLYYDGALLEARGPTTRPDALASVVRADSRGSYRTPADIGPRGLVLALGCFAVLSLAAAAAAEAHRVVVADLPASGSHDVCIARSAPTAEAARHRIVQAVDSGGRPAHRLFLMRVVR